MFTQSQSTETTEFVSIIAAVSPDIQERAFAGLVDRLLGETNITVEVLSGILYTLPIIAIKFYPYMIVNCAVFYKERGNF